MFDRVRRAISLFSAAIAIAAAAAAPGHAQASPRIVAVGDLHGDYGAYREIVRAAGLVDDRDRWAGGDAIFVQTGDIADRGPDSLRIMRHLMRLQRQAAHAGGRVVALVGNHEAMNVTGDLRHVHPGEFAAFADANSERRRESVYQANRAAIEAFHRGRDPAMTPAAIRQAWIRTMPLGRIEHQAAWGPEGELGRWVGRNPAVALIDGTLFVHGGISAGYAHLPIAEINRLTAAALAARDPSPEAIVTDPSGPLWYRGLVTRGGDEESGQGPQAAPRPSIEEELEIVLRAYGARRIVVGHTPVRAGIAVLHGGRLVRIDTGIAAYYRGRRTWLEIRDGNVVPHVVR
ncbi:MAG TPA: metallophosphoesterase [Allosphingosinicella sp.]|nr:metallophosphoesterase [Allosphingosinicella sp.]